MFEELLSLPSDLADLCSCGILLGSRILLQRKVHVRVHHFFVRAKIRAASEVKETLFMQYMYVMKIIVSFYYWCSNRGGCMSHKEEVITIFGYTTWIWRFLLNDLF
mmetsp:Transcript_25168/g.38935  ORF Transcript_25168/g.38935 Transcript_25168/m.38935 type:complete len:106 (+) Transcript_25168:950-1267(+)